MKQKKPLKNKKISKKNDDEPKGKFASIVILLIMIFSIAGFALLTGGPNSGNTSAGTPSEIPFQEFQDQNTAQPFWGAIKNNEQFIFASIEGFEQDQQMANIASQILSQENINIYIDSNFTSQESVFLIEKALKGIKKSFSQVQDFECSPNTLILSNKNIQGNCIQFVVNSDEAYNKSEKLVYFLIK